jgi:addiction module toxin, txe/yoeB family
MKITFTENAFSEYLSWQHEDKKTSSRINELLKDIQRNGFTEGIGKPEILKGIKAFSRHIDEKNRLVYIGDEDLGVIILSCKGHYDD